MKKSLLLALLALALTASVACAAKGEWIGGGQGGIHVPSSDYGDLFKTGFVGGVFVDYTVNDMFAVGANLDFNSTKAKDEVLAVGVDEAKFTLFNYGVHGNLYFMKEGMVRPYVTATAGAYNAKLKVTGTAAVSGEDTKNKFGFGGGAGLHFQPPGNPIGFGVEGVVHDVPDAIEDVHGDKKAAMFFNVVGKVTFSFSDVTQK